MARWITITGAPFDYRFPDRSALIAYTENGEQFVKDEIADFAVAKGYATEGKAEGSTTRSTKTKGTRRRKKAKVAPDAQGPADDGHDAPVDGEGLADDDRTDVQLPVDQDAG